MTLPDPQLVKDHLLSIVTGTCARAYVIGQGAALPSVASKDPIEGVLLLLDVAAAAKPQFQGRGGPTWSMFCWAAHSWSSSSTSARGPSQCSRL